MIMSDYASSTNLPRTSALAMILVLVMVADAGGRRGARRAHQGRRGLRWQRTSARSILSPPTGAGGAWPGALYMVVGYVFLVLPIVTMIVFSFQKGQFASIPGQGWTLHWYGKLFDDGTLLQALGNSLIVSPLAATGACVLGFLAAYAIHRFRFRGRGAFSVLLVLPILIPPLILGVAFLGLLSRIGLQGQLLSVVLTHMVIITAPAMAVIQLRLGQMPSSLEEAAWDLGATELQTLYKVVLPFALAGHRRRLAARLHLLLRRIHHRLVRLRLRADPAGRRLRLHRAARSIRRSTPSAASSSPCRCCP